MDRYYGLNRADITHTEQGYEISLNCSESANSLKRGGKTSIDRSAENSHKKQAVGQSAKKPKDQSVDGQEKKRRGTFFALLRYGICAAVLLVCFLGKFTDFEPFKQASGFIKDEINRDSITELYDAAY